MSKVACPCCKGRKWLVVYDGDTAHAEPCCHCMGEGQVDSVLEAADLGEEQPR